MPSIAIYNKCNNRCIMCSNPEDFCFMDKDNFKYHNLLLRLKRFYKGQDEFLENYRDSFSLTGGEPTLSPVLISFIEDIYNFFPQAVIHCLSNGRKFCYSSYAKDFFQSQAFIEIAIPLHSHKALVFDKITQVKGSFKQVINGLKNIFKFKKEYHKLEIRVVIHRLNYKDIVNITKFIIKGFPNINRLVYIFFEIEGLAYKNIKKLELSYQELLPYIIKLQPFLRSFSEVRFYHFPLCILPKEFYPYIWRTLPESEVSFLPECYKCKMRKLCLGVHKNYLKVFGGFEFKPIKNKFSIVKGNNWHHPIDDIKVL